MKVIQLLKITHTQSLIAEGMLVRFINGLGREGNESHGKVFFCVWTKLHSSLPPGPTGGLCPPESLAARCKYVTEFSLTGCEQVACTNPWPGALHIEYASSYYLSSLLASQDPDALGASFDQMDNDTEAMTWHDPGFLNGEEQW